MTDNIVEKATIALPSSFKEVLKAIDANNLGIIFVVNEKGRLIGSIADGDIRRAMIHGSDLEKGITLKSKAVNLNPFSLPFDSDIQEILNYLDQDFQNRTIKCIPLLDSKGRIIDISVRLREGRDLETRKKATQHIFDKAQNFLNPILEKTPFALSMEMRNIDPELSPKVNSIPNL